MPFQVSLRVNGTEAVSAAFRTLKTSLQKKHLRKAMNAAGKDVLWAARANTPKRSGLLYRSLGRKVKTYKNGIVVAIVGARLGYRETIGSYRRASRPGVRYPHEAGDPIIANPVKYLHLVELGTKRAQARRMLAVALSQSAGAIRGYLDEAMQRAIDEATGQGGS